MVDKSIVNEFLSNNKKLMPVNGKIPLKNWRNTIFPVDTLYNHSGNISWQIGTNDLVIDVDPRNGGEESFIKLCKDLNINLVPTVKTPRGGHHYYLKFPEQYNDYSFKKTISEYEGIDFLTEGSHCLIVSCETEHGFYTWEDELLGCFEQHEAPEELLNLISYNKFNNSSNEESELGDFEGLIGSGGSWEEIDIVNMLNKLDPSIGNDDWVKVGMALHDWDPIKGLDLWEDWSKNGDNYQEGETEKRWRSFDISGGVTLGTVSYMAKEVDYDDNSSKINEYLNNITRSNEKDLEFNIIPKVRKENFSNINIEKIAKAVQNRYKDIRNIRIPISEIRNILSGVEIINGEFIQEGKKPAWCEDWVYINSHAAFANLNNLRILKTEAFNITNGKHIPESTNGSKQSASKYVSDKGFIDTVDSIAYLPSINEPIVELDEFKLLNSFNSKTVTVAANEYSEEGKEAIKMIENHIKFICGTEENSKIFTQWLAHQIQFPGKQILWSPVIQSIQGVGKSFFGELLRCCLGDRNVGTVSPSQVVSDFNGWATGVSVNVLEELRVKGRNRYDAINSLKPLITDRMIQINDKGVKQYMTYNTTNYICFTNYKDSLPVDQDDRRWWVIFTQIESLNEMVNYVGEEASIYFPKLFSNVRIYKNEVRKWLLDYPISQEFLNTKQAPMTDSKMSMIATEEASFEGLSEIKELIEKGGKYFNNEVVSSSDLFDELLFEYPDLQIETRKRHILMKKLGYVTNEKPIKIDGKSRRIWKKKNYSHDEIRELLK